MIGNDVVDLGHCDSRIDERHRRFDERVFSADERAWISSSGEPERVRWSLWACKESAYKLRRRRDRHVVFAPSRMLVRPAAGQAMSVESDGSATRVLVDGDASFVHAVAVDPVSERRGMLCAVASLPQAASAHEATDAQGSPHAQVAQVVRDAPDAREPGRAVRELAISSIARELCESPDAFHVERVHHMPVLLYRGRPLPGTLSLSHHGRFIAFAWTPAAQLGTGTGFR